MQPCLAVWGCALVSLMFCLEPDWAGPGCTGWVLKGGGRGRKPWVTWQWEQHWRRKKDKGSGTPAPHTHLLDTPNAHTSHCNLRSHTHTSFIANADRHAWRQGDRGECDCLIKAHIDLRLRKNKDEHDETENEKGGKWKLQRNFFIFVTFVSAQQQISGMPENVIWMSCSCRISRAETKILSCKENVVLWNSLTTFNSSKKKNKLTWLSGSRLWYQSWWNGRWVNWSSHSSVSLDFLKCY